MRRMSFALTKTQLLDGSKTVTRRLGWVNLKPGIRLLSVSKCMGLKPGEKADIYGPVDVLDGRRERLDAITQEEVIREGFPEMNPAQFIDFFCTSHKGCTPDTDVTRIEFRLRRLGKTTRALLELGAGLNKRELGVYLVKNEQGVLHACHHLREDLGASRVTITADRARVTLWNRAIVVCPAGVDLRGLKAHRVALDHEVHARVTCSADGDEEAWQS